MNIVKAKDLVLDKAMHLRALLYGQAGKGKTYFIRSMPKPCLVFDFDGKIKPLYGVDGIDIISYRVSTSQECQAAFTQFRADLKEFTKSGLYQSGAIDSLTSFDTVALRALCAMASKGDDDRPTLPTYGDLANYYSMLFTQLKAIDKSMLVIAHELYKEDKETNQLLGITPLITGKKIIPQLPAYFEEVWHFEYVDGNPPKRVLHYKPYKKFICTTASIPGPGTLDDPTWDKIIALIMKG